jgi:8-hydroxy-5-deazaflavin:NADPH oxidoreductase
LNLAIIGSGQVGKALATSALRGGHDVTFSASNPEHATEQIQVLVPRANFVKAFNINFDLVLANPVVDGAPADTYVAGDDSGAKAAVMELARSMGFRPFDVGPLAIARALEGMALINVTLNITNSWPRQSAWRLAGPTGSS